ncbi:hypothetical protein L218DRAFT_242866 [Marasmius fiardii PR-910]|nr:hypothetical protein L218DRAFT_242866 [Marasmius fiardii PR-910]
MVPVSQFGFFFLRFSSKSSRVLGHWPDSDCRFVNYGRMDKQISMELWPSWLNRDIIRAVLLAAWHWYMDRGHPTTPVLHALRLVVALSSFVLLPLSSFGPFSFSIPLSIALEELLFIPMPSAFVHWLATFYSQRSLLKQWWQKSQSLSCLQFTEPSNQEAQHAQKTSLSLEITNPPSSSPFPSPSSSFLPPPMMQKNEFALPTKFATKAKKVGDLPSPSSQQPQNGIADAVNGSSSLEEPTKVNGVAANDTKSPVQASTSSSLEPSIPPPSTSTSNSLATSAVAPHGVTTIPSLTPTTPTPNSIFHKHKTSSTSSSPTTPLPTTPHRLSQPVVPIPSPPASPRFSGPLHPNSSAKKANRDSTASFTSTGSGSVGLTSSRPAPPSPAMSRRTSAALSRAGSTRRASGILGGGGDKRGSLLGFTSPSTTTAETGRASTPVPKDAAVTNSSSLEVTGDDMGMSYRTPIQIRDYGYSDSDLRQLGLGVDGRSLDVPKPNRIRLLNKRLLGEEGWRAWRKDEKVKRRGEKKRARDSVSSVASVGSSQFSEDDWEEGTVVGVVFLFLFFSFAESGLMMAYFF